MKQHDLDEQVLQEIFHACFLTSHQTRLIGGADEPLYLPQSDPHNSSKANQRIEHHIYYRNDYVRSALHEIAHWCVAGSVRRHILDYGYWYCPDGRNQEQQDAFIQAEVLPQSYEWLLSLSCGQAFEASVDNLNGNVVVDRYAFTLRIVEKTLELLQGRLSLLQQPKIALAEAKHNRLITLCLALQQYFQIPTFTLDYVQEQGQALLAKLV